MQAKVTKSFNGLPDGATMVRAFNPGDVVEGSLAEVAVREGWAKKISASTKPEPQPEPEPEDEPEPSDDDDSEEVDQDPEPEPEPENPRRRRGG